MINTTQNTMTIQNIKTAIEEDRGITLKKRGLKTKLSLQPYINGKGYVFGDYTVTHFYNSTGRLFTIWNNGSILAKFTQVS